MRQRLWALTLALAVAGCQTPTTKPTKAVSTAHVVTPAGGGEPGVLGIGVPGLVSEHGGGLISDSGGALTGSMQIPAGVIANNSGSLISDSGGAIIANNAGNIVANNAAGLVSNNAGSIISNHAGGYHVLNGGYHVLNGGYHVLNGGYHTLALASKPGAGFTVRIVDAAGKPVTDAAGKPYQTQTAHDGSYSFKSTPHGRHLLVRVDLPEGVGSMLAYLPDAAAGQPRTAEVNAASTLVMGYVLDKLLANQSDPTTSLQKLPGDVEATTRAKAATALGDGARLTSFLPGAVVPTVEGLARADAAFGAQVEVVKKILVAGLADVGEGLSALKVGIASPRDVLRLRDGSLLIAERNGNRIRRVDAQGIMTTFAGKDGAKDAGDDGPATDAYIDRPYGVVEDSKGNVYVADFGHYDVRKVDARTHVITRVAGDGTKAFAPPPQNDQPASHTTIRFPVTLAIDAQDRPYFATEDGVFRIEANGALHQLSFPLAVMPQGLAITPDGRVYAFENIGGHLYLLDGDTFKQTADAPLVADSNARLAAGPDNSLYLSNLTMIYKLEAGTWQPIPISSPHGQLERVSVGKDDLLICDSGLNRIWRMPLAGGALTPVAGLDSSNADALSADQLSLNRPTSLAMSNTGNLLVADGLSGVIWERRVDGLFYRFAGGRPALPEDTDLGDGGLARDAKLLKVVGMKRLHDGTILLTEAQPPTVRMRAIAPNNTITTRKYPEPLTVPALFGELPDGSLLVGDFLQKQLFHWTGDTATRVLSTLTFDTPAGIAVQPDGSYFIADAKINKIYLVKDDKATVIAGGDGKGFAGDASGFKGDNGPATAALLDTPVDLALGPDGRLYFSDANNDRVRRIDLKTNVITTVVGAGSGVYDGSTIEESIKQPAGLVFAANGDLYVADSGHNQVKLVEASKLK